MFPTNDLALPPPTIARLDKCRWQVALFFKWIEQHPRIKRFFGTAENAVKTRVRITISVYVPIAIIKKRRDTDASLDITLPVPSVTAFEKTSLLQMLREAERTEDSHPQRNRLTLFDYQPDSSGSDPLITRLDYRAGYRGRAARRTRQPLRKATAAIQPANRASRMAARP